MKEDKKNEKEDLENSETAQILPTEKAGLLEVSKGFVQQDLQEIDSKEEIAQYPDSIASPETKKQLIEAVKQVDKLGQSLGQPTTSNSFDNNKKSDRKKMEKELQSELAKNNSKEQDENSKEFVENKEDIEQDLTK